jgi:hypothetical protein
VSPYFEGLRDTTLAYPGDGLTEYQAFRVEEISVTPLTNAYNTGFDSEVNNTLFGNVVTANDNYFSLTMQDTGHPWGLITELHVTYEETEAYITDLAGNLLRSSSAPMTVIERTPPKIDLSIIAAGSDRLYLNFSEPVWGKSDRSEEIGFDDFTITGPTSFHTTGLEVLSRTKESAGNQFSVVEAYLTLNQPIDADDVFELDIQPAGVNSVWDKAGNPMLTDGRRITDIGVGVIEPVWATDSVHGVLAPGNTDSTTYGINSSLGSDYTVVQDFTGNEDSRLMDNDITLEASILAPSYTTLPVQMFYDVNPESSYITSEGYWTPSFVSKRLPEVNPSARSLNPIDISGALRDFTIPSSDSEIEAGINIDFLFRLGNLYTARLTDPTDPRSIAPWKIPIRGLREQTAGVTILNNVINPSSGEKTVLKYSLESPGMVTVQVFNLAGDLIKIIHRGRQGSGRYLYTWDGTNRAGFIVARGIYYIRVTGPDIDEYRKVMVVK